MDGFESRTVFNKKFLAIFFTNQLDNSKNSSDYIFHTWYQTFGLSDFENTQETMRKITFRPERTSGKGKQSCSCWSSCLKLSDSKIKNVFKYVYRVE